MRVVHLCCEACDDLVAVRVCLHIPHQLEFVQACALQVLGQQPVVFPECYKDAWLQGLYKHLFNEDYNFMWKHENGFDQWWIDALTVDPHKMLEGMSGLWEHGRPQPVTTTYLQNASPGSLPSVMVYLAVHPKFGTHAFYPYHGAKGGGAVKTGAGKTFDGFKFWFSDMKPAEVAQIVSKQYCNQPDGVTKFMKHASELDKKAFAAVDGFNPDYFMVCSLSLDHAWL